MKTNEYNPNWPQIPDHLYKIITEALNQDKEMPYLI